MTLKYRAQIVRLAMQSALDALLSVYTEQEWQQSFSSLSRQVAGVGPSHRAHLVALKLLPAHNPRGFALQQAAAASMLHGLCNIPSQVCMPCLFVHIRYGSHVPLLVNDCPALHGSLIVRTVRATCD